MRSVVMTAALVLLTLAAGACGETTPAEDELSASESQSPLAAAIGVEVEGEFAEAAALEARQQFEARTEECMAQRGFEYVALPVTHALGTGEPVGGGLDDEEFAQRYGVGYAPAFLESLAEGLPAPGSGPSDPNKAIYDALAGTEAEAWLLALWGNSLGPTAPNATPGEVAAVPGCYEIANEELVIATELLLPIQEGIEALNQRIAADNRILNAEAEWSTCMAQQGINFRSEPEMREFFFQELLALNTTAGATDNQTASAIGSVDTKLLAALEPLVAAEIAAAMASLSCDEGKASLYDTVRREHELDFVNENSELVERTRVGLAEIRDG